MGVALDVIRTVKELRDGLDEVRRRGGRVGMVGTSGAVHDGHLSLMRASAAANDRTVVFWGGGARFDWMDSELQYERDYERDAALVLAAGADAIFMPFDDDLFPRPPFTRVSLPAMSSGAPGLEDPAHLDLIAMVMAKLWNVFGPCRSYFGEKDWQQLAMFRRLAEDLSYPVDVVGCPTVREHDGVAMSSRNAQLSPEERRRAPALYEALRAGADAVAAGERRTSALVDVVTAAIGGRGAVEYVVAVEADTMAAVDRVDGDVRLLASMRLGSVRLVDNVGVSA